MKTIFILSTMAGSYSPSLETKIRSIYSPQEARIYKTEYKGHVKDLVKKYADEECIIYVCGGDGTFNEAASCLVNKKAILGILPMGTANDFRKNFKDKNFSIEATKKPEIILSDLIQVEDRYALNVLSFGLDTLILANTYNVLEKFPFLKDFAYNIGIIQSLFTIKDLNLSIKLELESGQRLDASGSFILGAICNGGYYGGGFNPSPMANVSDGILETVLVKRMSLWELARVIPKYKKGEHLGEKMLDFYPVKSGKIYSNTKLLANVDGSIFQSNKLEFKVLKEAIQLAIF